MLKKLRLLAFKDPELSSKTGEWSVQINPDAYTHQHSASFKMDTGIDTASELSKFKSQPPEELNFSIVLDATGVTPGVKKVSAEIDKFKAVAYTYNGSIHSPNYLKVLWGSLVFKCMLAKLNIKYELFSPVGAPLRAVLEVSFKQHQTAQDLARRADKKSADLTHSRQVEAGVSLPLMCHQVYGDFDLYLQVARENNLDDLTHLRPGARLRFPRQEV